MSTKMFVGLLVKDLAKSFGFDKGLGFTFDPQFTGDTAGRMVISEHKFVMRVGMSMVLEKPFACYNRVRFCLHPAGGITTVALAMTGPWPYLHRIMATIINTDKMVGGKFEKRLRDLKATAEKG